MSWVRIDVEERAANPIGREIDRLGRIARRAAAGANGIKQLVRGETLFEGMAAFRARFDMALESAAPLRREGD